ncbi:MAG: hypothetical protein JNK05_11420 [Myxococcales bacterium]|nr:hypothetical protein [Myxococcales bacterium]
MTQLTDLPTHARTLVATLVAATLSVACTPPANAPQDAGPTDASGAMDSAGAVDAGPRDAMVPTMCNPFTGEVAPAGNACVRAVEGSTTQDDGAPLTRGFVTVCGNACFVGDVDSRGNFQALVGEFLPVPVYSLLVHGRPQHASAYWLLSSARDEMGIFRMPAPLSIPRYTSEGPELPESMMITTATTATAGAVTLVFAAGSRLEFDFEDFELGALGRRVRIAEVPLDRAPPFAAEGMVRGPVFALGPFALKIDRPVGVRVANRAMLPAGSSVEFVTMGDDILSETPTAGHAVVAARGAVSMDGATIETAAGQGVRSLTWLGVRPAR